MTDLGLSNFNTSRVTCMGSMFCGCEKLSSLDLSRFDTSNVWDMDNMFAGCKSLTQLDINNFNTSKVTIMHAMFLGCESLKTIYVGTGWNISRVRNSKYMFENCTNLVGGKGTKYDSEFVDVARAKIDGCKDEPGYFNLKLES